MSQQSITKGKNAVSQHCFDDLFYQYKKILRSAHNNAVDSERGKSVARKKIQHKVFSVQFFLWAICSFELVACGFFLMTGEHNELGSSLIIGVFICFFSLLFLYSTSSHYLGVDYSKIVVRLERFAELLSSFDINYTDDTQIELLCSLANYRIARKDPLDFIKQVWVIAGAISFPIIAFIANMVDDKIGLGSALQLMFFVLTAGIGISGMLRIFQDVIYLDKDIYQQFIEDLEQIRIFRIAVQSNSAESKKFKTANHD